MQERLISFEGVENFRDFGGYTTRGGGRVKERVLFRSGQFNGVTETDHAKLDALGLRFILDLRGASEREHSPSLWPQAGAVPILFAPEIEKPATELPPHLLALMQQEITADSTAAYMAHFYRGFAFDPGHRASFDLWFKTLDQDGGPALAHCAAGKDRTGLLCALTLYALGVSEDDIFADYELTNAVLRANRWSSGSRERMEQRFGMSVSEEAFASIMGVRRDYLTAAFESITQHRGSIDAYLAQDLGVDDAVRGRLVRRLVE